MTKALPILLFVVGLINFLPVLGALSGERLAQAYAIEVANSNLVILLRHRALLFGIVGGFVLYSVFAPGYRVPAMWMAGISMLGYLFFMWQVGGYNAALARVMWVDIVGLVCLAAAVLIQLLSRP